MSLDENPELMEALGNELKKLPTDRDRIASLMGAITYDANRIFGEKHQELIPQNDGFEVRIRECEWCWGIRRRGISGLFCGARARGGGDTLGDGEALRHHRDPVPRPGRGSLYLPHLGHSAGITVYHPDASCALGDARGDHLNFSFFDPTGVDIGTGYVVGRTE